MNKNTNNYQVNSRDNLHKDRYSSEGTISYTNKMYKLENNIKNKYEADDKAYEINE